METTSTHPVFPSTNRRLRFSIKLSPFFFLIWVASQGCLPYLFHLGKEQAKFMIYKRPFEEVFSDPNVPEKTKEKLREVERIRQYGISSLALSSKGGFKSYFALDRDAIGWHVSACHPLRFESYTWWFPILGSVPYKGYFSVEKAKEEEIRLRREGWDTRLRITAGYSTLGWFEDPLFSSQLYEDEGELASLVLHEMAHSTVYFPGDSTFNESYASFIEEEGSRAYLLSVGGRRRLESREKADKERKEYLNLLKKTAILLNEEYSKGGSDEDLKSRKKGLLAEFKKELKSQKWTHIESARLSEREWNNEDFVGMLRYHSGTTFFRRKFSEWNGDFAKFNEEMKKLGKLSESERRNLLREEAP
ncbi:aminopeptidase [Leptospira fletcheri]|uniref:Aminopeptidase n=1 Tax=Leptospira fletcheri TaxID=2484981 RepID=A0A4R9GEH1_9LEPT|nr:aminopeptidase [Leptospira fletcheri]TGK10280.1 aminopeptidase [Leptospira fletcheri]